MNRTRRIGIGAAGAILALAIVTTGAVLARGPALLPGSPAPAASDRATPPPATPGTDPFLGIANPAAPYDLRFLDEMIMHHEGAIMSAQGMIANSSRPELRDLARRIVTTQQQQVAQMRAWRQQWYPDVPTPAADMGAMGGMGGMMGNAGNMMGQAGNGDQADRMFLRMMIPHHQLAIDMAQDALQHAQHAELKGLAREIIAGQSAEITEMEGYLRTWYGEGSTRDLAGPMREMVRRMMGGGR